MRTAKALTIRQCELIKEPGSYPVGGVSGLYLTIKNENSRLWTIRYTNPLTGKRTWYSIGPTSTISLAEARERARNVVELVRKGMNPSEERRAAKTARKKHKETFSEVYEDWHKKRIEAGYFRQNEAGESGVRELVGKHLIPTMGERPIMEIEPSDVASCLMDLWTNHHAGFGKVHGYAVSIFSYAEARNLISKNPADMRGPCGTLLRETGKRDHATRNWGALLPEEAPEFMAELNALPHTDYVRAFLFAVLTATRSANVRKMRWGDVDFENARWVTDHWRMKTKNDSWVLRLSRQAIALLKEIGPKAPDAYVFPRGKSGLPYKDLPFYLPVKMLQRRRIARGLPEWIDRVQTERFGRRIEVTQHGISRATFKTWSKSFGNWKRFNEEAVEKCLAHKTDGRYNGAYNRAELEEEKLEIMQAWADYLLPDG